jgi:hypothetical protein
MSLLYVDDEKFKYFCKNLTLDSVDIRVLDDVLQSLDKMTGMPSQIICHNKKNGFDSLLECSGDQIIIDLNKFNSLGRNLSTSEVIKNKASQNLQPAVHINLHSPALKIPQRIEIPLRYLLKGLPDIRNTYMVYLHALEINDTDTFVYYGVTKRGWMKRFDEHTKKALKELSHRKFPMLMRESITGRMNQLYNNENDFQKILTGSYHVVCAAGRSKKDAHDIENYLIQKRSLQAEMGLNMVSGKNIIS